MSLRTCSTIKCLLILLFIFELLAPSAIAGSPYVTFEKSSGEYIHYQNNGVNYFMAFLFEENTCEEREGKEYHTEFLFLANTFDQLAKFQTPSIKKVCYLSRIDSRPSLYTLHSVMRI